jgi:hypothetical protein
MTGTASVSQKDVGMNDNTGHHLKLLKLSLLTTEIALTRLHLLIGDWSLTNSTAF